MRGFLFFFFLFLSQSICAQKAGDTFTIAMDARGAATMNRFVINIQQSPALVKVVYAVKDSLSSEALKGNKEYAALLDQHLAALKAQKQDAALLRSIVHQIDSIEVTSFSKDSLEFKPTENQSYMQLLHRIRTASTELLENKAVNENRIVLDGTSFRVEIQSASGSSIIHARSPSSDSHPLLTELIADTMNLYRAKKGNAFLDKAKTNNY